MSQWKLTDLTVKIIFSRMNQWKGKSLIQSNENLTDSDLESINPLSKSFVLTYSRNCDHFNP